MIWCGIALTFNVLYHRVSRSFPSMCTPGLFGRTMRNGGRATTKTVTRALARGCATGTYTAPLAFVSYFGVGYRSCSCQDAHCHCCLTARAGARCFDWKR